MPTTHDEAQADAALIKSPPSPPGVVADGGGPRGSAWLFVTRSPSRGAPGARFRLEHEPTLIGRAEDAHVRLDDARASPRHARIDRIDDGWSIDDDGSDEGTFVNDHRVRGPVRLEPGDHIAVGGTTLDYLVDRDDHGGAVYHEAIYRLTITDGLTRVHNARYLGEALDREILRGRRHCRELSALAFDVGDFAALGVDGLVLVNPVCRPVVCDFALREIARVVQTRIRRDEVFARISGAEFAIVLPDRSLEDATALARDLHRCVALHGFAFEGTALRVAASFGCSALRSEDRDADDLLSRARRALVSATSGAEGVVGLA